MMARRRNVGVILTTTTVVVLVMVIGVMIGGSESVDPYLGIHPQDEKYYRWSGESMKCREQGGASAAKKTFTKSQLNDDFCDCPDGTDEPGTSACPHGKFYCRNAGHTPLTLFSSRVNDGICDCCDGSDEYDGQVKCPNTCWEAGKVARDKLKAKIATYKQGVSLRNHLVRQAQLAFAKDKDELSSLQKDESVLKQLVQQLKERKEQLDKAEEKERLRKEQEQKASKNPTETPEDVGTDKDQSEEKAENVRPPLDTSHHDNDHIGTLDNPPSHQDEEGQHLDPAIEAEHVENSEIISEPSNVPEQHTVEEEKEPASPSHNKDGPVGMPGVDHATANGGSTDSSGVANDAGESTEGLSKEELGRLVASRWTGNTEKQSEGIDSAKDREHEPQEDHEDTFHDVDDAEDDGYASETDDDTRKYDADVEDDDTDDTYEEDTDHDHDTVPSYQYDSDENEQDLSEIKSSSNPSWLEKIQQTVRNILQAVNVFQTPVNLSDAANVRKEYEESSSKLTKLQSRISSLTKKLEHDFGADKEFYSFYDQCFEGKENKYVYKICPFKHASQQEGHSSTRLGRWDKFEDSYRVMVFSNGDKCWNGPDRSMKVKLRCGLKNEVSDVDEPSRCEYLALLSTPALCLDQTLKELEEKLLSMKKERPEGHDEL